jgi:hypothetical protein
MKDEVKAVQLSLHPYSFHFILKIDGGAAIADHAARLAGRPFSP